MLLWSKGLNTGNLFKNKTVQNSCFFCFFYSINSIFNKTIQNSFWGVQCFSDRVLDSRPRGAQVRALPASLCCGP